MLRALEMEEGPWSSTVGSFQKLEKIRNNSHLEPPGVRHLAYNVVK